VSSNYHPLPLGAVVLEDGVPVGGISIPAGDEKEFIREFRERYGGVGLSVFPLLSGQAEASTDQEQDGSGAAKSL